MSKSKTVILNVGAESVTTGSLELVSRRIEAYFNDLDVKVQAILYYSSTNHISVTFNKKKTHVDDYELKRVEEFGAEISSVSARKGGFLNVEFKLIMGSG